MSYLGKKYYVATRIRQSRQKLEICPWNHMKGMRGSDSKNSIDVPISTRCTLNKGITENRTLFITTSLVVTWISNVCPPPQFINYGPQVWIPSKATKGNKEKKRKSPTENEGCEWLFCARLKRSEGAGQGRPSLAWGDPTHCQPGLDLALWLSMTALNAAETTLNI